MDGNILKNKANLWSSNDEWNITTNDKYFYIENISKKKVLGTKKSHGRIKVIEEDLVEDKPGQLWKRGNPDSEGYFTVEISDSLTVMTAIPSNQVAGQKNSLEMKSKYNFNRV